MTWFSNAFTSLLVASVCFGELQITEFDVGLFVSSSPEVKEELSSTIDEAFQSNGIIKLVNISLFPTTFDSNSDELYKNVLTYFEQTTMKQKMKFNNGPPGTPGYLPPKSEGWNQRERNLREVFGFIRSGNQQQIKPLEQPPILHNSVKQFWLRMDNEIILPFINAVQLSFNSSIEDLESIIYQQQWNINYYYNHKIEDINENENKFEIRHVAHIDGTCFTFLWTDNEYGLQMYCNKTSKWYDIHPDTNSIFVLNGELIPFYTQNRWKSSLHRVVCNKYNCNHRRISYAYFIGPDINSIIYPWKTTQNQVQGLNVKEFYTQYMDRIKFYPLKKNNHNEL